jgi:hypothetical protein
MALGRVDRVEIGVGDADVPRDEAVVADLDQFLGHDEGAVHESKVADGAAAFFPDGEGAAGVTGNVVAQPNGVFVLAAHEAKDLRGLAVKAFAEVDVRRNGFGPPIGLDAALAGDVAHVWEVLTTKGTKFTKDFCLVMFSSAFVLFVSFVVHLG